MTLAGIYTSNLRLTLNGGIPERLGDFGGVQLWSSLLGATVGGHPGIGGMAVEAFDAPLKALMLKGLGGDAAAHAELLTRMAVLLRRFFARKLGASDQDVEDLVQETLLAIHLKRETWDSAQPFTAWAYAIARYRLIDLYRRRRVRRSEPIESAEALFAEEVGDSSAGADVERLLSELPERQRVVLKAVKLDELSTAEAAARTGMSESAVKVSVHRSLKALMRRVRDEDR